MELSDASVEMTFLLAVEVTFPLAVEVTFPLAVEMTFFLENVVPQPVKSCPSGLQWAGGASKPQVLRLRCAPLRMTKVI
ncbi:MAG TPA: hypothetical protein VH250_06730 [Granulicella sp.]|nr:hypothetical protein [Granulicella sp.]